MYVGSAWVVVPDVVDLDVVDLDVVGLDVVVPDVVVVVVVAADVVALPKIRTTNTHKTLRTVATRRSGNGVGRINEVTLRRARSAHKRTRKQLLGRNENICAAN